MRRGLEPRRSGDAARTAVERELDRAARPRGAAGAWRDRRRWPIVWHRFVSYRIVYDSIVSYSIV